MDSITQAFLGAAVGQAVIGKKVGNKTALWGAVGGTIPDLDVFANAWVTDVEGLLVHRGFSHSIVFVLLASPLLGYLVFRLYRNRSGTRQDWTKLFFWSLITHPLLDIFTNYGTQLFWPLNYRLAFNTIFVVDPLYTLPLIISVVAALFLSGHRQARKRVIKLGLVISSVYLTLTVINKFYVELRTSEILALKKIEYHRKMTLPAPLNNVLWSVIAESKEGYYVGYYSLFDQNAQSPKFIPRNENLLTPFEPAHELRTLKEFSKGYYVLQEKNNDVLFNDLRFGTSSGWFDLTGSYIFSFTIAEATEGLTVQRRPSGMSMNSVVFAQLLERAKGI